MKRFGLVGFPLGHSFSKQYFKEKFERLKLKDHTYWTFEMELLHEFPTLWIIYKDLIGVNITVPHKKNVMRYLDRLDTSALKVGAVNVVKKEMKELVGYNTDYMAFLSSLNGWIGKFQGKALILGSGGASKAVQVALADLKILFSVVSRIKETGDYTYNQLAENPSILSQFQLIINTTPLGMHPKSNAMPDIPYSLIKKGHYLYDLIYNPSETLFLSKGKENGAVIKNGKEMLELQAEMSWDIWKNS
ncbi:MAG: shikimate dehydrogenase [Bacteroidota bacterium]